MAIRAIHQVMTGAAPGSSTWGEARSVQAALRGWGLRSDTYVGEAHAALRRETIHFSEYRPQPGDVLLYHFTAASPLSDQVFAAGRPIILLYHNVTPARYYANANPRVAAQLARASEQLATLRPQVRLALAHSEFSRRDLIAAGYEHTAVIPGLVSDTLISAAPDVHVLARFGGEGINLLAVGRLAPNKRPEDAVKALHAYRRIEPRARLFLAGASDNAERYVDWLHGCVERLGLGDSVHFCGHVTDAQLAAYYRLAHVLICMSEHEGFCIPLVEAMRFGVPILAFESSAIPETLGGAGVLIREKRYPIIAEVMHVLNTDAPFRDRVIARQKTRAAEMEPSRTLAQLRTLIGVALEDTA